MRLAAGVALAWLVVVAAVAQDVPSCGSAVRLDVDVGQSARGRFNVNGTCPEGTLLMYRKASGSGNLQVNARGEYLYAAPQEEMGETFAVAASCGEDALCQLSVGVSVARPLTMPPSTDAPSNSGDSTECARQFFTVALGSSVSDSLGASRDAPPCNGPRTYATTRQPSRGTVVLASNGDFRFDAPASLPDRANQYDDFGYAVSCQGTVVCRGAAYVTFVAATAPPPTTAAPQPQPSAPSSGNGNGPSAPAPADPTVAPNAPFVNPRPYMTCRGTCNRDAWPVSQNDAAGWDTNRAPPRRDGKAVDSVETAWEDGRLVIRAYSKIGSLGLRFPAFEELTVRPGDVLSDVEVRRAVAESSVPFDIGCLGAQSPAGYAANVWEWTADGGHVGRHYKSGSDWYHKFGGKHLQCDTFLADSCRYAPLLTPRSQQDSATEGVWSVQIDGCDVTWTGVFTFAAMRTMRRRDGTPVFTMDADQQVRARIVTEAVKPVSEVRPMDGVATNVDRRDLTLGLEPWTTAVVDEANRALFSVDVEYFQYRAADTGDRAFGLNLLFYPHVADGAASSYRADAHVAGFRWNQQTWSHPDSHQCPTCTGTDTTCAIDTSALYGDGSFLSNTFLSGNCRQPRVALSRGPSFAPTDCPASRMHNFNRPGFSRPRYCRNSFQNITIRGVAPGSAGSNASHSFAFEGRLQLELLLDNGQKPVVEIDLGMVVALSATDGVFTGRTDVCRGDQYWPVLDPLGKSLPDEPHKLADVEPVALCVDRDDRTYGPEGWALVTFSIDDVPAKAATVESLTMTYPGAPVIVLRQAEGASLPEGAVAWADEFPFLNFRDLTARLPNQTFTYGPDVAMITDADYAFAFTPGAIGVTADVAVKCVLRVASGNTTRRVTFTRMIHTDSSLSALSRFGPPELVTTEAEVEPHSTVLAMAASGGILAGLLFVCVVLAVSDTKRPLPKWMPKRMPGFSPAAPKRTAESKRATVRGIPVRE